MLSEILVEFSRVVSPLAALSLIANALSLIFYLFQFVMTSDRLLDELPTFLTKTAYLIGIIIAMNLSNALTEQVRLNARFQNCTVMLRDRDRSARPPYEAFSQMTKSFGERAPIRSTENTDRFTPLQIKVMRFLLGTHRLYVGKQERIALLAILNKIPHPPKAMGLLPLDLSLVSAVRCLSTVDFSRLQSIPSRVCMKPSHSSVAS